MSAQTVRLEDYMLMRNTTTRSTFPGNSPIAAILAFPIQRLPRTLAILLSLLLLALLATPARAAEISDVELQNRRCLTCHGQSEIAGMNPAQRAQMIAGGTLSGNAPSARPELYVTPEKLKASVHGGGGHNGAPAIACVACHSDAATLPHKSRLDSPSCASANCHGKQASAFLQGSHAAARAKGDPNAPTCATCHGGHDILAKTDRNSKTFPLNVVKVCATCHEKHIAPDLPANAPRNPSTTQDGQRGMNQYLESVHGRALQRSGLTVAATCADCHGPHDVRPSKDPASLVNRANVPTTCGQCHVGVSEMYVKSIHGEKLAEQIANPQTRPLNAGLAKPLPQPIQAPVCSDCHTAHAISRTDSPEFMRDIVNECGSCHDKPKEGSREKASLYETYRASYHGQVTALGYQRAARCSDCHGAHNISRIDDPNSPLNEHNKLSTCQKCHKGADTKFASFAPHADFRNSDRYPILHYVYLYFVIMMSASFGFFGLHCIFWFLRSLVERIKHGPPHKPDYSKGAIQRFNRVDRVNHGLVIVTFFGLALTGLPLLYSDKNWALFLAGLFGGPRSCGILHRVFAVMLIGNFVVHGVGVVRRFKKHGIKQMLFGPTTMLPTVKDAKDCLGMFRWFFVGGQKPKFDRWTYWEKFDYTAEVGGSAIIGLSGLFLWFPVFFSQYLPGWMFNVATVVHGFEALLAVGFIFTIHFFNAHLRLEKFPVDDVMFTGRLPEEEFKHERGAEYDRMVASGEIAKLRVNAPPTWYRHFAVFMGISAMVVGTTIVVLIILAALRII